MLHYFIWNGTDSRTKHIRVNNRVPIVRPEERVEHITIPGRAGDLTQVEGKDIYNSYIQTVSLEVIGKENVPEAEAWLTGGGYVTFDTQPDLRQTARIINAVTFEKFSRNLDFWRADVQFYCEPVKRSLDDTDVEVTASATTITNPGNLEAFPLIEMTGSGAVTVTIGSNTLIIPNLETGWVADCENQWILDGGMPVMNAWQGDFPVLQPGNNTVLFTGSITKLTITPRWRYL